jgi:hypothetical protein
MTDLRVVDNDRDEISVMDGDKEVRGWSYSNDTERRVKMLCAHEFVEGYYHAQHEADTRPLTAEETAMIDAAWEKHKAAAPSAPKMPHTSGPWEFLEFGREESDANRGRPLTIGGGPNNDDIANVFSSDDSTVSISREEAIANARLIAASPELLSALETLTMLAGDVRTENTSQFVGRVTVAWQIARAAIAKAKGESL